MKTFMQATLSVIVMLAMTPWPKITPVSALAVANSGTAISSSMAIHINEIIDLDTYDPGGDAIVGPVVSTATLLDDQEYLVTISGTISYWFSSTWSTICRGTPETLPQIPSPGIQNGKVGSDPQYTFASPTVWSDCRDYEYPISSEKLEISVDDGVAWSKLVPINQVYNPLHVYQYRVLGGGHRIQFRLRDQPTNDNYGILRINIEGLDPPPTCQTAFSDEFNATLDPQWSFVDPQDDATQSVTARIGYLRITAPTGNDLYPVTNYNAPRLLQRVTGDFAIETHIEFAPAFGYQGVGLLVWQDDNNFLRLERGNAGIESPDVSGIRLDIEQNGVYDAVAPTSQRPTPTTNFELRLQRNGSRFMAWWREPGQAWDYVGGTDTAFNDELLIGLALISEYGVTQTTADYDYFRITCPSTLTPPVNLQARTGLNAVLLAWEPSASFGVTGYHLYRQAAGEATFTRLTSAPIAGLVYRDTTVNNAAQSYTYYATAVNAAGQESDPSNTATVTPGKLTLVLPTVYAQPGMTTTVAANLENGDGLCIGAMDVGIRYNPQVAQATKVAPTALTQGYTFIANFTLPQEAHIASTGNCQTLKGPGSLILVDFAVRATAAVSTPLTFVQGLTGTVLYDSATLFTSLPLNLINGQLILTSNGGYKRGDLNGDGVVNASDAVVALQIAAGSLAPSALQRSAGDVNGDGVINAGDAAMILYFAANQVWPTAALAQATIMGAGSDPIQLQPLAVGGNRGQTIEVPLQINQGEQVAGATLIARYGKGLTYEGVELDTLRLLQGYTVTVNALGTSELRLSLVGRQPLPSGPQLLGTIHFDIDPDATNAQTQVAVVGAWLSDQAGRDFSLSILDRTVIGGESAVHVNQQIHLPVILR